MHLLGNNTRYQLYIQSRFPFSTMIAPLLLAALPLLSTTLAVPAPVRRREHDRFIVDADDIPGLAGVSAVPTMHAGHMPLYNASAGLPKDYGYFFWRFHDDAAAKRHIDDDDDDDDDDTRPLVFWLNGGPGCSSMDGALVEAGPLRIDSKGNAYLNEASWADRADIVFVDQPAGTGFSAVKGGIPGGHALPLDSNLDDVSWHFCQWLVSYYREFPMDIERPVILAGESYAGQYIPYIARTILRNNMRQNEGVYPDIQRALPVLQVYATLIGNGWIDPVAQSLSYLPFAIENGLVSKDTPEFPQLLNTHEQCQKKLNSKPAEGEEELDRFSIPECDKIINELMRVTKTRDDADQDQCINVYNFELKDSYPACGMNWPADIDFVANFFDKKEVRDALHINADWAAENWVECRKDVMDHMRNKGSQPAVELLPELIDNGVQVVLFNGDKDLICNNKGITDMIDQLKWGGATSSGFSDSVENFDWVYRPHHLQTADEPAGYVQTERNLTFINVYNASHMVPHDKPKISRGIIDIAMDSVLVEVINKRQALVSSDEPYSEDYFDDVEEEESDDDSDDEEEEKPKSRKGSKKTDDDDGDDDDDDNRHYIYYYYGDIDDQDQEDVMLNEDPDYHRRRGLIFTIFFVVLAIGAAIVRTTNWWWPKLMGQFQGAYSRLDRNPNKTVTWADDADPEMNFEMENMDNEDFEIGDSDNEGQSNNDSGDVEEDEDDDDEDSNSDVSQLDIGESTVDPEEAELPGGLAAPAKVTRNQL